MNEITCHICGGMAITKRIAKAFGQGDELMVIENIPLIICRKCHEQYITAETLHEIEQLRTRQQHQSRMVCIEHCAA